MKLKIKGREEAEIKKNFINRNRINLFLKMSNELPPKYEE